MSHLILSHLSKNNNDPGLVKELFDQHARGAQIIIASRYEETDVFYIHHGLKSGKQEKRKINGKQQLSLF
jgi:hypothetical protein